jgi:hypothetical protein
MAIEASYKVILLWRKTSLYLFWLIDFRVDGKFENVIRLLAVEKARPCSKPFRSKEVVDEVLSPTDHLGFHGATRYSFCAFNYALAFPIEQNW